MKVAGLHLERSRAEKRAAARAMNEHMREMERVVREMRKEFMHSKREKELEVSDNAFKSMVKTMRKQGASEQAIQKAAPGIALFTKYYAKGKYNAFPRKSEQPQSAPISEDEFQGMLLSDVQTQHVRWLWEKRIPLGKLTILDGDHDMGKSLLAITLAASVTTGRSMPGGTPGIQGGVILITPEDDASDTLRPRLEAAGGDPSGVLVLNTAIGLNKQKTRVVKRPFSLAHDLEDLEKAITYKKAVLVILDPLTAVLGQSVDASGDQDLREIFTPLSQLAQRTGCAILIVRYLNKGASEKALYRGAGSIGILDTARVGLLAAQHPYEENTRILATTKNNLGQKAPSLSYQVVANPSGIPTIQWLGENTYTVSSLFESESTLSLARQQVLQVLQEADSSLTPQEIAQLTGQAYTAVRITLCRMHEAREIMRPSRGKYQALPQRIISHIAETSDTTVTNDASDTTAISDISDTSDTTAISDISDTSDTTATTVIDDTSDTTDATITSDTSDTSDTTVTALTSGPSSFI